MRGIEFTDDTLSYEVIKTTAFDGGFFLCRTQTIERMETGYYYPDFGDRRSSLVCEQYSRTDILERARKHVKETLVKHYLDQYDLARDEQIRERFNITPPPKWMKPSRGRRLAPSPGD